jgi:hypothetical protein
VRIPRLGSSRIHLPASLRSTGITPLPRYYGRSDSWAGGSSCRIAAMNAGGPRPGLPDSWTRPSHRSVANHLTRPSIALTRYPSAYWASRFRRFGLRLRLEGSPSRPAESRSLSYGPMVHLQLLSTPPRGDAVTFGYRPESVYLKGTRTPRIGYTLRRTSHGFQPVVRGDRRQVKPQRGDGARRPS